MNEEKKTKNIMAICIIAVIIALIIAAAAVLYSRTEHTSADPQTTDDENEIIEGIEEIDLGEEDEEYEDTQENESEPQKETTKYYGGTYFIIGTDNPAEGEMPEGEYVLQPDYPEGGFELVTDLSGDPDTLITSGTYNVRTYVTVSEGQYLKFDGVAIPIEEAEAYIPKIGYYDPQAMYKVGFDIQPGEYAVRLAYSDEQVDFPTGTITILRTSTGSESSIISEITVEENTKIELEENTYVKIDGVTLSEPID